MIYDIKYVFLNSKNSSRQNVATPNPPFRGHTTRGNQQITLKHKLRQTTLDKLQTSYRQVTDKPKRLSTKWTNIELQLN
mgnify:CR=1 FL=1